MEVDLGDAGELLIFVVVIQIDFEGMLVSAAGLHPGAVAFVADADVFDGFPFEFQVGVDEVELDAHGAGQAVALAFVALEPDAGHACAATAGECGIEAAAQLGLIQFAGFLRVPFGEPFFAELIEFGAGDFAILIDIALLEEDGGEEHGGAEFLRIAWAAGVEDAARGGLGLDGGILLRRETEMDVPDTGGVEKLGGLLRNCRRLNFRAQQCRDRKHGQ